MDYISREAALNFEMSVECSPDEIQGVTDGMALYAEYIKQQPAADAVDVVRCKECRWWDRIEGTRVGYCHACKHGHWSKHWEISIRRKYKENFFCADGERKDGDGDADAAD